MKAADRNQRRLNKTQAQELRRHAKRTAEPTAREAFKQSSGFFGKRAFAVAFAVTTAFTGLMGHFKDATAQTAKTGAQTPGQMTDEQLKAETKRLQEEAKILRERQRLEQEYLRAQKQREDADGTTEKRKQEEQALEKAKSDAEKAKRDTLRAQEKTLREQERAQKLAERQQQKVAEQQIKANYVPPIPHFIGASITSVSRDGMTASLFGHEVNRPFENSLRAGSSLSIKYGRDGTLFLKMRLLFKEETVTAEAEFRKAGPQVRPETTAFKLTSNAPATNGQPGGKFETTDPLSPYGVKYMDVLTDALLTARKAGTDPAPEQRGEKTWFKLGPIELRH